MNIIGTISLPYFDGSSKCTTRSWVQNLDTYFQLNPMVERESIKLDTIHLDGESNECWFPGINTLVDDQLTTYEEFKIRLIDIFEIRDPKISFRELPHVKQTGTPRPYIYEFQKLVFMVTDILEYWLILLLIEGLEEPLKYLVKEYIPSTCKIH